MYNLVYLVNLSSLALSRSHGFAVSAELSPTPVCIAFVLEPSPCELFDCGVGYTNKVGECSLPGGRNLGGESRADDDFRSDDEYTVVDDDWVPDDDDTTCTLELCCELARGEGRGVLV